MLTKPTPFGGDTGETLSAYNPGADTCYEDVEWMHWHYDPYPGGEDGTETVWLWRPDEDEGITLRDHPPGCLDPTMEVQA